MYNGPVLCILLNPDKQELMFETSTKAKHLPINTIHTARLDDENYE